MTEIIVQVNKDKKEIALIESGKLEEYYTETKDNERNEGNIYIGIVRDVVKGMEAAFVDIGISKNTFIHLKDLLPKIDETKKHEKTNINITQIVKPGQKVLVQVKKDSTMQKGARVSTHINLPSKYVVLMPNTDIITVSQKIEDENERKRLIKLVKENLTEGNGAVIRTLAEGKSKEIIDDIKKVESQWQDIIQTSIDPENKKPQLLYKSEDILQKILIDLMDENISKIVVNDKKEEEKIKKILKKNSEYKSIKLEFRNQEDVFGSDIRKQIKKIQNRKIWLRCGGFITIDPTEALTAIDVNTGKYTGTSDNLQKTILKVNKEATTEIAKQLRLRDIGGIVIIDYIDMENKKDKDEIIKMMKEELKKDRSKTQVEGFTKLDLMELTRKHICSRNK